MEGSRMSEEQTNERRGFMTTVLAGAIATAGTMWLPAGVKEKVEEEGLKSLTLDEVNEAFKAMTERMNDLERRVKEIEDKETLKNIGMQRGSFSSAATMSGGF
jgi:hypothetical protein